jgi:hypothetical protein
VRPVRVVMVDVGVEASVAGARLPALSGGPRVPILECGSIATVNARVVTPTVTTIAAIDQGALIKGLAITLWVVISTLLWIADGRHNASPPVRRWIWRRRWLILAASAVVGFLLASSLGLTA